MDTDLPSHKEENEFQQFQPYKPTRSRPGTPGIMLKMNEGLRKMESPRYGPSRYSVSSEGTRLAEIQERNEESLDSCTDEHGDVMELSENFQKLKISRNQPGPCSGAGDAPSQIDEGSMRKSSSEIVIQSLGSRKVVHVPETHRSDSRGRVISSGDEIPIHPAKYTSRNRKPKIRFSLANSRNGRFYPSRPDEIDRVQRGDDDDSDVGESDRDYGSIPSTARTTCFSEEEMLRPETASSEILADAIPAVEREEQLKIMKDLFGMNDSDWYDSGEEDDTASKYKIRRLTKLFYRRIQRNSSQGLLYTHKLMLGGLHNRLEDFVLLASPPGFTVKTRITRVKKGVAGRFHPLYYMHLERDTPGDRKCLIMVAKKHTLFGGTGYIVSTDPAEVSMNSEYCVGKISSNFIGTEFTLYSGRPLCSHIPIDRGALMVLPKVDRFKEELITVVYDPNVLGFKGPRKIKVLMPKMQNLLEREVVCPRIAEESLLYQSQNDEDPPIWSLKNKDPIWNRETHSYILNFAGRVNTASVKNFQIVCQDKEEHVLLQFGRSSENTFSLDFQYPFCPLQAFAIALTSFDSKIACE